MALLGAHSLGAFAVPVVGATVITRRAGIVSLRAAALDRLPALHTLIAGLGAHRRRLWAPDVLAPGREGFANPARIGVDVPIGRGIPANHTARAFREMRPARLGEIRSSRTAIPRWHAALIGTRCLLEPVIIDFASRLDMPGAARIFDIGAFVLVLEFGHLAALALGLAQGLVGKLRDLERDRAVAQPFVHFLIAGHQCLLFPG